MVTKAAPSPPADAWSPYHLLVNFLALVGAGALVSWWLLYYTDWFPLVGGLLGLGGAFAWLSFLANLVSESSKKELQKIFEQNFLFRPYGWLSILIGLGFLALLASFGGTVLLQSLRDDRSRSIQVGAMNPISTKPAWEAADRALLQGHSTKKIFLFHGFQGKRYRIKLSGLPSVEIEPRSFKRVTLTVPDRFLQEPVALVRPTPTLSQIRNASLSLVIELNGELLANEPFDGRATWVGCDRDVAVPPDLVKRWHLDLALQNVPVALVQTWLPPKALAPDAGLRPGDRISASIRTADGSLYGPSVSETVPADYTASDFPIELILDIPQ